MSIWSLGAGQMTKDEQDRINLLMSLKPNKVDVFIEWYQWAWLALLLPPFAWIGSRIGVMRARILRANAELVNALGTIQDMATHDSLTGLHNRASMTDALEHAFNTRSWSAIEMMSPELLEDGYARVREFAQAKIAEAKGELPPEPTPAEKFDKDLRDSKDDAPKKDKTKKSGK